VLRAGGQVERTASGHLMTIGPAGSAIVPQLQQRPCRWARRPQHPGDVQEEDRAASVSAPWRGPPRGLHCPGLGTVP
jgi:hypothetical protein